MVFFGSDWILVVLFESAVYQNWTMSDSLNRINALKAEIAGLEQAAISELVSSRASKLKELEDLDAEIGRITGKASKGGRIKRRSGRIVSIQELTMLLERAPGHTLNIRKEKLDLASIKSVVVGNSQFSLAGKGSWPTVSMV